MCHENDRHGTRINNQRIRKAEFQASNGESLPKQRSEGPDQKIQRWKQKEQRSNTTTETDRTMIYIIQTYQDNKRTRK
jgi:hypothetical protein